MWKQIKDFDYEINTLGIIRRISNKKLKKAFKRKDGYIGVQLYILGKCKNYQVHRLIAIAFIPNPENKRYVNHIDSNRSNNELTNLEWVTHSENVKHGYSFGYANNKGSNNGFSVLTEKQVLDIRYKRESDKLTYKKLAEMYNVSTGCIIGIVKRHNWKHI